MKKKGFTLIELIVVIAIIAVIGVILLPGILKVCNQQEVIVTVTDKGIKGKDSNDKYLIYTDVTTYEITDSLLKWRWNSSDLYGAIQVGKTYKIETGGYRIGILSEYPNIYKATEVEPTNG